MAPLIAFGEAGEVGLGSVIGQRVMSSVTTHLEEGDLGAQECFRIWMRGVVEGRGREKHVVHPDHDYAQVAPLALTNCPMIPFPMGGKR